MDGNEVSEGDFQGIVDQIDSFRVEQDIEF